MRPTMTLILTLIVTALFSFSTSALAQPTEAEDSDWMTTADGEPYTLWADGEYVKEVSCFVETYRSFKPKDNFGGDRPQLVEPPSYCARTAGEVGFSFGLVSSPNALVELSPEVGIVWWATERFGVGGGLRYSYAKSSDDEQPVYTSAGGELLLAYVLVAGESTRLNIAGGVGFQYDKESIAFGEEEEFELETSTSIVSVPLAIAVEHFFTDTVTLSVGAGFDLLRVGSEDDGNDETDEPTFYLFSVDTTKLFLNLTWYTD